MHKPTDRAMYPSLRQRVVLITGGASGIGEALVRVFAAQRAKVVFLDVQDDIATQLASSVAASGDSSPTYKRCDLRDVSAIQRVVGEVLSEQGSVDVLVNNAGNDSRHSISSVTSESWDEMIAINLKSQFFVSQAVIPSMQSAGRGSIINLSSIAWEIPSTGLPVYVAAKAGIIGLTRTLAHELGSSNIRVNAVMPGAVETERQKKLWLTEEYKREILSRQALKKMISPEDVANLVLFLAADDSSLITNQSFVIDGGWI